MKDIIFVNSHPIQYFAPMYKYMNRQGITTKAWYGSDESVKGGFDQEFGTELKWDIPLLEGYEYRFFKNYSPRPSHANGFFGLMNFGMIKELFAIPKSVIVMHGWHYFTHFLILMLGKLAGHTVCIRCDIPLVQEQLKSGWKQKMKYAGLKYFLFPRIDYFLYIGEQNRLFYKSYKIADSRLLFCPYAVDNERFNTEYELLKNKTVDLKAGYSIPVADKVFIFSAKYIEKKRPLDLLHAFKNLGDPHCWLFMVGEGELRKKMEEYIQQNSLQQVILTGFINQSKISEFYAFSDVFVMCSGEGENWGLSVNEALNFQLPVILSDLTGCSDDLVVEGCNGYTFTTGDVDALTKKLGKCLLLNKEKVKETDELLISKFSYDTMIANLFAAL